MCERQQELTEGDGEGSRRAPVWIRGGMRAMVNASVERSNRRLPGGVTVWLGLGVRRRSYRQDGEWPRIGGLGTTELCQKCARRHQGVDGTRRMARPSQVVERTRTLVATGDARARGNDGDRRDWRDGDEVAFKFWFLGSVAETLRDEGRRLAGV